jgi:aspartyl protease family protein
MTQDDGPWRFLPPRRPPPRPRTLSWVVLCAALGGIVVALVRAFPQAVRTRDDWVSVAYAVGLVVLISAGVLRSGRILRPQHLKYAAAWAGIIAVLALAVAYRSELAALGR